MKLENDYCLITFKEKFPENSNVTYLIDVIDTSNNKIYRNRSITHDLESLPIYLLAENKYMIKITACEKNRCSAFETFPEFNSVSATELPPAPLSLSVFNITNSTCGFNWTLANSKNEYTKYKLSYKKGEMNFVNEDFFQNTNYTQRWLKDLIPGTYYTIKLSTINSLGESEKTLQQKFKTKF
ncbi:angiopoietin-1 receptor-like isoform X2 [Leptopilina heterotoma]|nr:angiopoietin-1 receptor-like isoform X2 [Leptopilina heterotoma]